MAHPADKYARATMPWMRYQPRRDTLQAYNPTMTQRIPDATKDTLRAVGVNKFTANALGSPIADLLGYSPVGAAAQAWDVGAGARKRYDQNAPAIEQILGAGGGMALAALGAVPGGKALARKGEALAMDEASRMARAAEQGFTKEAYHGADAASNYTSLRPSANGELGPGVYVGDVDRANWYAKTHPRRPDNHGAVFPLLIQDGKYLDEADFDKAVRAITQAPLNSPEEMAARVSVTEELKKQGYLGVRGSQSARGLPGDTSDYSVFDPANIRSKFAAFDPAKRGSANLLAALGLGGLGYGLMSGTGLPAKDDTQY